MRDWFPVSVYGAFAHLCDVLHPKAELGSLFNDIHPNHGIFSPVLIDSRTKEIIPVASFFDVEQFIRDIVEIADLGKRPVITKMMIVTSLLRNLDRSRTPADFGVAELRGMFADCFYRIAGGGPDWSKRAYSYTGPWRLVMVTAMHFQDAYNYDLVTISDSATPMGTQEGEISFCAYNGGRWRKIVEHLHQADTVREWNRTHSRHTIYSNGKEVNLERRRSAALQLVQIERANKPRFLSSQSGNLSKFE